MISLLGLLAITLIATPARAQDAAVAESPTEHLAIPATDADMRGVGPVRRYTWFQNLWNKRRAVWADRVSDDQGAVVFFGDSITQGWGDEIGKNFDGLKTANRGISGDTTRGMLHRVDDDVLALNPAAVVMLMGTNDLEEGASADEVSSNVAEIIAKLKQHDRELPIVLCQVFPSSATKKRPADKIKAINEACLAAVKGDARVIVIDTWTLFANKSGDAKSEEFPDLLHPNKVGYAKWAAALRPILATLELIETESQEFNIEPGFESLFNGHDLTGWGFKPTTDAQIKSRNRWQKNNPNAPVWPIVKDAITFAGSKVTPNGRYAAINGRLVVTTPPEGRKIQQLWTTREFPSDFVLRLEFRATPNADSGVFLRAPQLQCRDFPLAGPYKELKSFKPMGWNALEVVVTGGTARCTCNGEVIEAAFKLPETGPIGLEGDRGQIEYRRIRVKTP